jgi:L-ascorbate metabolism protein UlaG (beta-lactamase superfamily)
MNMRPILLYRFSCLLAAVALPALASQGQVKLSYLGTAGWEITDGKTVVLVDPYLSRLNMMTPGSPVAAEDPRPVVSLDDVARSDEPLIDAHIHRADYVLITHTHIDHVMDAPYIARKTGAILIGTESTTNFLRAGGVPDAQLITVKGGDDMDFGVFSVRVIPSLHSIMRNSPNIAHFPAPPPSAIFSPDARPPFRVRDLLVEGGTLAYFIRLGGVRVLVFGSMNYIERELEGLHPDVAIVGASAARLEIYKYTSRLLRAIGYPPLVLPTHWDRFNVQYSASQQPQIEQLKSFIDEVRAASPKTQVIVPAYFQPITVMPRASSSIQKE